MNSRLFGGFSGWRWRRIAGPALALMMAAIVGSDAGPVWAQENTRSKFEPGTPDQRLIFEGLDQWMSRNSSSFEYDPQGRHDPFLPMKAVRKPEKLEPEDWPKGGCYTHKASGLLKLVAITSALLPDSHSSELASFEDSSGASIIVRQGDCIEGYGYFGGGRSRVVEITDSTVTVEEPPRGPLKEPRLIIMHLNALDGHIALTRPSEAQVQSGETDGQSPNSETASRSPLLADDISAFKLVAITVLDGGRGAFASFEDQAGASYVLRQGSRIGKGRIVEISNSTVTVEEMPRGDSEPVRTIIKLNEASPLSSQETK